MAGDLEIEEQVIIVPPQAPELSDNLAESLRQEGVRVLHRYGPRVMIGEVPEGQTQRVRAALNAMEVAAVPDELSSRITADLDPIGALGLAAFSLRQSKEYIKAKEERPYQNMGWNAGGKLLPPDPPPEYQALVRAPTQALGSMVTQGTTSQRMTGRIAVGIIIVSGPTPDLQFTAVEQTKIIAEVQNGLGWHQSHLPTANITWLHDIHTLQVNVQPGTDPLLQEALWRNPAMVQLGYEASWLGVIAYINHIKAQLATDWTYVGYFTKYPLPWFAYAEPGGPRLVMQYENDSWGPDNIDRVFAHETGHIFQAPDEYSDERTQCNCGGSWGIYNQPNGNCDLCAPDGGVDCLMRKSTWAYCAWTRLHYGVPRIPIEKSIGAITVDRGIPHVFVTGADENLWVIWFDVSGWRWSNQSRPSGVNIESSIGTVTVGSGKPYVFVKGSDGNLWVNWWSGSWSWSGLGQPSGITLAESLGVIVVDGSQPYAFVKGSDGNLWANWLDGTAWKWSNLGRPSSVDIESSIGAVTVNRAAPYVFIKGSDGNLWVNWWSGSWNWTNNGRPNGIILSESMGVIAVDGSQPYAFVKGSDANLWVNWLDGTTWRWSNQRRPSGVILGSSIGAVIVNRATPYVFIKGSDGNLWVNWMDGPAWRWSNHGRPSGVGLTESMGVTVVDGSQPYAFVKGSDGNLWVNWLDGTTWRWSNLQVIS